MNTTALKTDMYEFTMLQAALESGAAHKRGVFELYTRRLPAGRSYGVVAGVERAVDAIVNFTMDEDVLAYLSGILNAETVEYLRGFRFSGDVSMYREGDVFFPFSPVVQVEGTFGEAVLLETILLSIMNYDSAVAGAASHIRQVAGDIPLQELGSRRVNEDAAVVAARAAFIGGFAGTSNLLANLRYGVPVYGTSAHAFSLAHESEVEAFAAQVAALGVGTTLLVDTFDIPQGIRNAVEAAGTGLGAIRLDSGDPLVEIPAARALLDSLGATGTRIIFSGDLDKETVAAIVAGGVPCDGFGIGSAVVTGDGFPNCGFVFKLVSVEWEDGVMHPVAKKATGKGSVGGRKLPFREHDADGVATVERLYVDSGPADVAGMVPCLERVIVAGERVVERSAADARNFHDGVRLTVPLGTVVDVVFEQ